jgi:hypothetical protein
VAIARHDAKPSTQERRKAESFPALHDPKQPQELLDTYGRTTPTMAIPADAMNGDKRSCEATIASTKPSSIAAMM